MLFSSSNVFSQWACYPLGNGGQVVCGWACYSGHQGQDWQYVPNNSSYGQNIYAVYDGIVRYIQRGYTGCDDPFIAGGNDWNQPANFVIIEHSNGFFTRSFHVKDVVPGLTVGSVVKQGQVIAYIGNVGPISPCDNSNPNINAHLHFEVGTGWGGGISLSGRFDPVSIFTGCYPPFACGSKALTSANCSGNFEDTGGSNATYSNKEDYTFTIAPAGATSVAVKFNWIDIESGYDFLYAYNGTSTSAPLIGTYSGSANPGTITANSGAITFRFISDVDILKQGWSATWNCITAPPPAPLSLSAVQATCPNISVNLSWQNSGSNWTVDVSDDPNFSYFWYRSVANLTSINCPDAFAHSSIPNSYLIFQPTQTYYWRVWDGVSHTNGSNFTVPSCISSVSACAGTFTDAGGASGNYTANEDYVFVIQPQNAAAVTMNFIAFDVEQDYDSLWVYDGTSTSAALIGVYTGTVIPASLSANSGAMTLRFKSDSYVENAGWTANWSCLSATGMENEYEAETPNIHPNPNNGVFTFTGNLQGVEKYELINSLGQVVHSGEVSSDNRIISSNLPAGIYYLRVKNNDKYLKNKVIIGR